MVTLCRKWKTALVVLAVAVGATWLTNLATPAEAQSGSMSWFDVRSIYTRPGAINPAGVAFLRSVNSFIVIDTPKAGQANTGLALVPFYADESTSSKIVALTDPLNFAYSQRYDRFWSFDRGASALIAREPQPDGLPGVPQAVRFDARAIGILNAQGMTFDANTGHLFILDAGGRRVIRITPDAQGNLDPTARPITRIELRALGTAPLRGIAFNPTNNHLYVMDANGQKLSELTDTGALVSTWNLTALRLASPQSMTFAPSVDNTDAPGTMNLYLADAGRGDTGGRIVELALDQPRVVTPRVAGAATLAQTINTWQWSPPAPDPSGIVYWPATGRLLMTDSEVDEMPNLFTGQNVFELNLNGALYNTYSTTAFSNEPTGVAVNASDGHLIFSKDGGNEITDVNLGPDGQFGTADDSRNTFSVSGFGVLDAEDVAYGAGKLYIADGKNQEVWAISPGPNGQFDGPPSVGGDDTAMHFDTATLGVRDPEGIAYDAATGNLWLCSRRSPIVEVTTTGTLVRSIDISFLNPIDPDGITVAPGSNNPAEMHLYIADRMMDNNEDPNENDGRVYELVVDGALPAPTSTPTSTLTATPKSTPVTLFLPFVMSNTGGSGN